jgi:outer membrane protein assembly factor BamB
MYSRLLPTLIPLAALFVGACNGPPAEPVEEKSSAKAPAEDRPPPKAAEATRDWPMFGGTPSRNMVNAAAKGVPTDWGTKVGGKNLKWVAEVGSPGGHYLPPAVAGGQVYFPTNNGKPRDPRVKGHKAVLMCLRESDGQFLWQIAHDLPDTLVMAGGKGEGLLSTPVVQGDRLYYVTPGAEVVCADTKGKVVWTLDMRKELKVSPDAAAFCSPLVAGDLVFVVTGNGKDFGAPAAPVPEPKAPSFVAVNKKDGKVAWSDNSPGENVMEGSWASPVYAEVNGKGQVIFPGGDGWLYAFEPKEGKLVWKFDCNPKGSVFQTGTRGTRSYLLAPVVHEGRLYTAVGQQPDNGPGIGHLWCVDITKTGDLSEELEKGKPNPDKGVVWHYGGDAPKGDPRDYVFGRSISTCAVHDGLVYAAEYDGFLHCLDARTGKHYWDEDVKANIWASPLWVDGKVYLPDDSGNVSIFEHGKEKKLVGKVDMESGVKAVPVVANGVLYIATDKRLFAITGK